VLGAKLPIDSQASQRIDIPLSDGNVMACAQAGTGPVILLVHGWAADGRLFANLHAELSKTYRVITPDLRAHGLTPRGSSPLTIETLAEDLWALIEDQNLQDVTALGWSMGALALWRMIELHGHERLAGLVVEDMSPRILNDTDWSLGMSSGLNRASSKRAVDAMVRDWPSYAKTFAPQMFSRHQVETNQNCVEPILQQLTQRDGSEMAELWASMAQQDLRDALPSMNLPVLVTYGEHSEAYSPETSRYLVNTLPDAQRIGFASSGHAPHIEEPEEFCRAVTNFACRVGDTANRKL
jgi:pimeloyl-ACP methyl ester carboxylesterase